MSPKSAGQGGDWCDGTCCHCGSYGHKKAQRKHLDVEMAAKGKGNRGKGPVKGKGFYHVGTNEEDETETPRTTKRERSEQQGDGTTDGAWLFGSMNALARGPRIRWALPTPQKGATNRFAVLAEPDTDGIVDAATHTASGI